MIALSIGLGLFLLLIVCHIVAVRAGAAYALRQGDEKKRPELGAVSGALLGLLGLLLAFTFSSAAQRFLDRQDLVTAEANALGTAWLRAGAAPAPQRDALRALLADYADLRVDLARAPATASATLALEQKAAALHAPIWEAGLAAADARPDRAVLILPPLNDVIDLHTTRAAATRRHHRPPVLVLLGVSSIAAIGLLGFSAGLSGRHHMFFQSAFALIAAGVLWLTIDLDYPRAGLVRLDPSPLADARAAMNAP